uniref:NADH-ubiquinone oxidoreductase chain 6 n=1 Tax=Desmognathus wrighti TaxID=52108 RepID=Q644N2_9SALA|nr:NADH dehydrogenase subunit 6 [Desmognathus wrighti]AAU20602.1 NADH dehydrogenase subunit 6 [Desmognathus wrighti]
MIYLSFLGLAVGFIAVASNPSPYYGAFGLVLGALCSCWVLVMMGISFLSLVLLLIYLGGMLVVFAYSVSMAAEPYPEAWGNWAVLTYIFAYLMVLMFFYTLACNSGFEDLFSGSDVGLNMLLYDCSGVGLMYSLGMLILMISGWALLLTLFVVLEVTRGMSRGALRVV